PNGIISSNGRSVGFERDAQGRITKVTTPTFLGGFAENGVDYRYVYDGAGDLVTVELPPTIGPQGFEAHHYTYAAHRLLTTIDPRGNTSRTSTYYPDGRLATDKDALNNVTS